jgi:hypothetical protein
MQQLGFKLLNDISWVKPNPPPNLSCRYFTHATETIIWAAKSSKSRHTFHYKLMKEANRGKQVAALRSSMGLQALSVTCPQHFNLRPDYCLCRLSSFLADQDSICLNEEGSNKCLRIGIILS